MIALTGGTIVELKPRRVRRADILIDGDRIVSVGEIPRPRRRKHTTLSGAVDEKARPPSQKTIDCSGAIILPGLVCGHTHLYSALARGMPPPSVAPNNFVEILERVWWKLDRALDSEAIEVSALLGAAEAVRAGVTTLVDHHASPSFIDGSLDLVGGALETVGLRGVLCYEVTDRGGPVEMKAGLAENDRFLASLGGISRAAASRPLLRGMVGAHAGFTLAHDSTVALADVAVRRGAGVHIHVAEDACDARHVVPAREVPIVEWLDQYRLLGPRSLLAHCVHVDKEGAERIAKSGAFVAHNPRSNMNNAVGYARPQRFGSKLLLGTDGIGADMLAEAQAAFLAARHAGASLDPLELLAANHSFAATAFDDGIGRIEPGCPADLAIFDYDPPTPLDESNLFGHLLFGLTAAHVRDVLVAGNVVMRERTLQTLDEPALRARARAVARQLWERMDQVSMDS